LTLIIFRKHLDENLFQLFSLIGSLASLFGLLFVWLQTSDVTEEDISSGKHLYALLAMWIVIGLFLFWSSSNKQVLPPIEPALIEKMNYPLPDKPSIAVLPFDNMTGDTSQDYLSDGISENIISALSGISNLFVIARNSTFTYKDKPVKVQQVSEDLGVRYVLEGSVQKSGSLYRLTAQLIDAIKGNHLWSEKYDRELDDLFMVQDEITKEIIAALNVELTQGEQARTISQGTDNLEAYLKVMQAREHIYKHNVENNASAQQLAQEALTLDPNYAAASRILGVTHMHDILLGRSKSPKQSLGEAMKLVKRAIELDDQNGYSHVVLGFLLVLVRQYDKAVAEAERGVSLDPNVADIYGWLGMVYRYVGRSEDAVVAYEKAIRLNPIPPNFYLFGLGLSYAWTERYEEAVTVFEKAIQDHPDAFYVRLFAAAVYSLVGRDEEARAEAAEVLRLNPKFSLERWGKSLRYKNQEDQEQFISALSKAGLN
jgi:TolB-like protein/Flp pilus assembly protein TadD